MECRRQGLRKADRLGVQPQHLRDVRPPVVGGALALGEIPLTVEGLDGIDLKPEEIAHVLRVAISAGSLGGEASL
ncbi:hypothetical protein ACIQVO_16995 [Streptomyces sp. NPDC101062]|uniref:hypothetical protein n=1 Tax=unclassified Streptomyces TaxID=2593676 RepID=UPI002E7E8F34|nr:hypothetical protein [Streptomyces sp. JV176]